MIYRLFGVSDIVRPRQVDQVAQRRGNTDGTVEVRNTSVDQLAAIHARGAHARLRGGRR
jgi:hypothetical protein